MVEVMIGGRQTGRTTSIVRSVKALMDKDPKLKVTAWDGILPILEKEEVDLNRVTLFSRKQTTDIIDGYKSATNLANISEVLVLDEIFKDAEHKLTELFKDRSINLPTFGTMLVYHLDNQSLEKLAEHTEVTCGKII